MGYPLLRAWFATKELASALFTSSAANKSLRNSGEGSAGFISSAAGRLQRLANKMYMYNGNAELKAERELTARLQAQVIRRALGSFCR